MKQVRIVWEPMRPRLRDYSRRNSVGKFTPLLSLWGKNRATLRKNESTGEVIRDVNEDEERGRLSVCRLYGCRRGNRHRVTPKGPLAVFPAAAAASDTN